jgi:hypothetical protein
MIEKADLVVAFPGGIGTIDELTEAIALKQLGQNPDPIVIYDFLDFWKPMLDFFDELHHRGMISQNLEELFKVVESHEAFFSWMQERQ